MQHHWAEGDTFEITVSATGYLPQSFTYTTKVAPAPAEVNTEALKATIRQGRRTERIRLHGRELESNAGIP